MVTTTGIAKKAPCPCVGKRGDPDRHVDPRCKRCLGFGWLWGDGRPPTYCHGGGKRGPLTHDELVERGLDGIPTEMLKCSRSRGVCEGCDRKAEDIGLDPDIERTVKMRDGKATL